MIATSKTYIESEEIENIAIEFSRDEIGNLLKFAYCLKFIPATFHRNAQITYRNALRIFFFFRSPSGAMRFEQSDLPSIRYTKQYFLVSNFAT